MEIDSSITGTPLREYKTTINWRDTMNYAASVGDENQWYFNDERQDGIVAPPMFSVAVTWPISEKVWDFMDSNTISREVLQTQVHYTEHLVFHRPILPGDSLTIQGEIAAVLPHRIGTVVIIRYDAVSGNGEPVFTEYMGGLLRGVACLDKGAGQDTIPARAVEPDNKQNLWETGVEVSPLQPFVYDGCTGIFFPIHTSIRFARSVGLPGIILQGTATLAFAARELVNREADGDPRRLSELACRFTGMVKPGTSIIIRCTGKTSSREFSEVFFEVLGAGGERIIRNGYAKIYNKPIY